MRSRATYQQIHTEEVTGSNPVSPTGYVGRSEALFLLLGNGASGLFGRYLGEDLVTVAHVGLFLRFQLVDHLFEMWVDLRDLLALLTAQS
jgi:hypothetical protein